jgi:hypothetical protein
MVQGASGPLYSGADPDRRQDDTRAGAGHFPARSGRCGRWRTGGGSSAATGSREMPPPPRATSSRTTGPASRWSRSAIISATVVFPVPGAPVKHMCRSGRDAESPNRCRARRPAAANRFFHLLLHRDEPDQFAVQRGEQVIDACCPPFTDEGDRGIRLERFVPQATPAGSGGPCRHPRPKGPPGAGYGHWTSAG